MGNHEEMQESPTLESIEVAGTPRGMGESFGEAYRGETHELYERRLANAIEQARLNGGRTFGVKDVLSVAGSCLSITEEYDPTGFAEFLGIARGASLSPEQLFVTQGLTDFRDILAFADNVYDGPVVRPDAEGCSSFLVAPDRSQTDGVLAGQTWDLYTDNMPYVRLVHRKPSNAPETISLTLTGCLSLIGLNSEGIAVGNTNLCTRDARIGVQYLSVIHRALRSRSAEEAVASITAAPRSAAHYYYVADRSGDAVGLECSATRHERFDVPSGILVHCNHSLGETIRELEVPITEESTYARQSRLTQLLGDREPPLLSAGTLKRALSDGHGGDLAICRYRTGDFDVSTNAAVVMSPRDGAIHACRGQPDRGVWRTERVG